MVKQRKAKSALRENIESIVIAIILALVMREFVVQAFKIPSGSMQETLQIGDHILVNKFLYYFTRPQRFDVIVFEYPWDRKRDFIKRIIALPGDWVEVRDGHVYVNNQRLLEPYAHYSTSRLRQVTFGPLRVPKKGDTVEIRQDQRLYINGESVTIPSGRFSSPRSRPPMTGFEVFYASLFAAGTTLQQPTGPIKVQHDHYFTLGDNRDNSQDSRFWGFVKNDRIKNRFWGIVKNRRIKGKAFFIYWSWNRNGRMAQHIRWDRLGKLLGLAPSGQVLVRE